MKKIRIVFIGGFLMPSGWKCHPNISDKDDIEIINVYPSPVASIHDRVCEIFYELLGGRVYYGHDHSHFHGHEPYGKEYLHSKIENWNEDNPIYLVGHSYGGVTARAFQTYLSDKRFSGYDTNERWIAGIVTVNSPLNGALMTYLLGAHAHFPPIVSWGSVGYFLSNIIHLSALFNLDEALSFQFGHWNLGIEKSHSASKFGDSLLGVTVGSNTDNAAYDMTIQSQLKWAQVLPTYPNTYYLSIVGRVFPKIPQVELPESPPLTPQFSRSIYTNMVNFFFYLISVKEMKISNVDCSHWFYYGWDGLVSCYSQIKPALPSPFSHPSDQSILNSNSYISKMSPGVWYSKVLPNDHLRVALCCTDTWNLIWHAVVQMELSKSKDNKMNESNFAVLSESQKIRPDLQPIPTEGFNRHQYSYPIHRFEKCVCLGTTFVSLLLFAYRNFPELYIPLSFFSFLFAFGINSFKFSYFRTTPSSPSSILSYSELIMMACNILRSLVYIYLIWSLQFYTTISLIFTIIASKSLEMFLLSIFCDNMHENSSLVQLSFHIFVLCLTKTTISIPSNMIFLLSLLFKECTHVLSKLGWFVNSYCQQWWNILWITFFSCSITHLVTLTQLFNFQSLFFFLFLWEWISSMKEISYAYQIFKLGARVKIEK